MAKTNLSDKSLEFLGIIEVLSLLYKGILSNSNIVNKVNMKECEILMDG